MPATAQSSPTEDQVGDSYEISTTREMSQQGREGASGSSYDRDVVLERVIDVRGDGLELEYDLPVSATAEERARVWQFPARIFRPNRGSSQLINTTDLEARLDTWLKTAGWTREVCGRWIFTWNAFRIECDPQSVLTTVAAFDLRLADLHEGASYSDPEGRGPGVLKKTWSGSDGVTFGVTLEADPDKVRRARAETDVAVSEIMQKPLTLDEALQKRMQDSASGAISITLETDAAGNVRRRTRIAKLYLTSPSDGAETQTVTTTVERRLISRLSRGH